MTVAEGCAPLPQTRVPRPRWRIMPAAKSGWWKVRFPATPPETPEARANTSIRANMLPEMGGGVAATAGVNGVHRSFRAQITRTVIQWLLDCPCTFAHDMLGVQWTLAEMHDYG